MLNILLTRSAESDGTLYGEILSNGSEKKIEKITYILKTGEIIRDIRASQDPKEVVIFNYTEAQIYRLEARILYENGDTEEGNSNVLKVGAPVVSDESRLKRRIPNLKGNLKLGDPKKEHRLLVKFKEGGIEYLKKNPETLSFYDLLKERVEFQRVLEEESVRRIRERNHSDQGALNLYRVSPKLSNLELLKLAEELEESNFVEYCSLESGEAIPAIVSGISGVTGAATTPPDFQQRQGYLDSYPGVNAKAAWRKGIKGQGSVVRHLDFGVYRHHIDLLGNINVVSSRPETEDCNHGTASTGIIAARHNGYGVMGIAQTCNFNFYDTGDMLRMEADANPGDILSFDIQWHIGGKLLPYDYQKSIWDCFQRMTKRGVIVICAAGNGSNNLHNFPEYTQWGENGGMLIGAGESYSGHKRLGFSNYGHQVYINAWGHNVTSTGYKDLWGNNNDNSYTSRYSGTSSATPICAGALALIQSYAKTKLNVTLGPASMRELLLETGIKGPHSHEIGPRPDVGAAIEMLEEKYGLPGSTEAVSDKLKLTEKSGVFTVEPVKLKFEGALDKITYYLKSCTGVIEKVITTNTESVSFKTPAQDPGVFFVEGVIRSLCSSGG
ncbi:hypothetical protein PM10SUCC1_29040 [Propionigenium maris DSM 9537]|uniref:Peptidase S8/S53 domain-containing protein n=1 Tax=Propionigenium maris DSM 9537 TaxID=1123000 RepID=A0A9W6GNV0_9FUSO|nr:S8 family serine peptidase [Propionigenium maris]GLI57390.1 hypothetical protein PM10SUCC1_29040 [Propionigenium maris DSM 9537]